MRARQVQTFLFHQEPDRPCVFLRMGVDADSTKFSLEYNLADFRTPDERGWVAQHVVINADEDDALKTMLPLDEMLADLERVNANARISTDPGRYICNYVYFHSLHWVKTQDANVRVCVCFYGYSATMTDLCALFAAL
jgi:pyrrolidone-carboxylate peptidase